MAITSADIERRRGRLLAWVCLVLSGFAALAVVFSFLGPGALAPLQHAPFGARLGVMLLTIAFIALVWEREHDLRRLLEEYNQQQFLSANFENRLEVLSSLLEVGDRLNAPLAVDDVVRVILDAAMDLAHAEDGSIEVLNGEDGGLLVTQSHSVTRGVRLPEPGHTAWVALRFEDKDLAIISLTRDAVAGAFEESTIEILDRFAEQAARALDKAKKTAHDRASIAYLEAANLVKSRFLATVSHELRTPLTSVIGYSATLANHWDRIDEATKTEFVREVHQQGLKLHRMVERILEAARIEIEGGTIKPVRHDLRMSVKGALLPFDADSERLEVAMPGAPLEADADPAVIEQVVSNLVDNALRYTDGHVRVALDAIGNMVTLSVADQGPGIGVRLEDLNERLTVHPERQSTGTGLGLHIVQTLVRDHGGTVEIGPREGRNAVTVTLPRRPGSRLRRGSLVQPDRSRI